MKSCDLTVSRTIRGTTEEVYDAWLDPDGPGSLFFGCKRVIANREVDGLFFLLVDHEGREWAHYGRFMQLDRGQTLRHTWMSEPTKGLVGRLPGGAGEAGREGDGVAEEGRVASAPRRAQRGTRGRSECSAGGLAYTYRARQYLGPRSAASGPALRCATPRVATGIVARGVPAEGSGAKPPSGT